MVTSHTPADKPLRSFLLWVGLPLSAVLAATGLQVFWPGIYWREKPISIDGAFGSDLMDLCVILPTLVIATVLARRGSLRALLVWTGALGYLAYNFAIYTFSVHFNAMFPAYCAVMGLSFYGLAGVREFLEPDEIAKTFGPGAPRRPMAVTFIVVAVMAAFGELKEIVAAIRAGVVPASAVEAGQLTNPIHVLDLSFLLPALAICAVLLLRRKPLGFTLAPVLSVVLILIGIEVALMIVLLVRSGRASDYTPALSFAGTAGVVGAELVWYFRRRPSERAMQHKTAAGE